jgi:hypothetical protein
MKKPLLATLTLIISTYSYGQESKVQKNSKNDGITLLTCQTLTLSKDRNQTKYNGDVNIKFDNKLQIESDSAFYDSEKKLLITYGTRNLKFNGTVTLANKSGKTCKYYLGEDTLTIE